MSEHDDQSQCLAAKPYYYDVVCGLQGQIPPEISAHITDCSECQQEVQWLKQADAESDAFSEQTLDTISHAAQMELHCKLLDQPVRCSDIKAFLPVLAVPESAVRITTPVTAHIQACKQCAKDLQTLKELDLTPEQAGCLSQLFSQQQMDRRNGKSSITDSFFRDSAILETTIRKIMDRPDSGVVTCLRTEENAADAEDQPYNVVVVNEHSAVQKQHSPTRLKWWFKPAAAVAAVAVIAFFLFRDAPVDATDIGRIYEALKSVQNVVMTQYDVDIVEPVQQITISRSRGIKLVRTGSRFVLYDIENGTKDTKGFDQPAQQVRLEKDSVQSVTKSMNVPYGLLPFNSNSELPKGAQWKPVQSDGDMLNPGHVDIYDLFWSEPLAGADSVVRYQWRCHLDPATNQPFKLEFWKQGPIDPDYVLTTITEITYPSENQIEQIIEETGF